MTAPVDAYRQRVNALAESTTASALVLYDSWESGEAETGGTVLALAALLNWANSAALSLGDQFVAVQIESLSGEATPAVGLPATDDSFRLADAFAGVLDDVAEPPPVEPDSPSPEPESKARNRVARIARAEPWTATQFGAGRAIEAQPLVQGWRRGLSGTSCERCLAWAENGRIFAKGDHFKKHIQCDCLQEIVLVPKSQIQADPKKKRSRRNA